MQINLIQCKLLTQEEKYIRQSKGLCLYCGESNHIAQNCPNKERFKVRVATPINKDPLSEKKKNPILVGTMQLNNRNLLLKSGLFLLSDLAPCFLIPLQVKSQHGDIMVEALLSTGASACFIDKKLCQTPKFDSYKEGTFNTDGSH